MTNISYKNEIIVLFNGYSYTHPNNESIQIANCTCTLIKGEKTVIIDTMTPWDKDAILTGIMIIIFIEIICNFSFFNLFFKN